jgi:hypothetical protein
MDIKIAIASNKNFYKHTIPVIVKSLVQAGIPVEDIHIFNAGFDTYSREAFNGATIHYLAHNSYEYSPLIEIVDKQIQATYWFLIHDTCQVGPNFKNLLYNIPETLPEKIALTTKPSMTIGTYRYDYLLTVKDKLMLIRNTDYSQESLLDWKRWGVPHEDYILWMTEPAPHVYGDGSQCTVVGDINWYGTNTTRRTEYFPTLDLYKNKSNWGQTGHNMVIDI